MCCEGNNSKSEMQGICKSSKCTEPITCDCRIGTAAMYLWYLWWVVITWSFNVVSGNYHYLWCQLCPLCHVACSCFTVSCGNLHFWQAGLIRDLNAVSASELGELDYDTRLNTYDKVRPQLFLGLTEEHVGAILSHCVYDMSSEELILRQSASRALQSFLDFSASVMNNDVSKYSIDDKSRENNTRSICTMGCIQKILEKTYLHNMGVAMTKDISIQKVRIYLLFFSL